MKKIMMLLLMAGVVVAAGCKPVEPPVEQWVCEEQPIQLFCGGGVETDVYKCWSRYDSHNDKPLDGARASYKHIAPATQEFEYTICDGVYNDYQQYNTLDCTNSINDIHSWCEEYSSDTTTSTTSIESTTPTTTTIILSSTTSIEGSTTSIIETSSTTSSIATTTTSTINIEQSTTTTTESTPVACPSDWGCVIYTIDDEGTELTCNNGGNLKVCTENIDGAYHNGCGYEVGGQCYKCSDCYTQGSCDGAFNDAMNACVN